MKLYRKRRKYQRLRSKVLNEENEEIPKWKGFRKFKVTPKLRVKFSSPTMTLKKFRDNYVQMMLCFAGRVMQFTNGNMFNYLRSHGGLTAS
ncbi:hypothetical protein F8388_019775 [Cannabis sativa]|uniref:Uncharacterized protein n=1 Tax=Cannabis sativa TaxID=3483 RepID=A0A7J6HNE1_CANSA|nr:hypothetical protein F8388_019775 [Cannabis sativa]